MSDGKVLVFKTVSNAIRKDLKVASKQSPSDAAVVGQDRKRKICNIARVNTDKFPEASKIDSRLSRSNDIFAPLQHLSFNEEQDRSIPNIARINADKTFPKALKVDSRHTRSNEIFAPIQQLSFKKAHIGSDQPVSHSLKCEQKFVDVYQDISISSGSRIQGWESEDSKCLTDNSKGGECRITRIHPMKMKSQKAECEPTVYTYKNNKISDLELKQIVDESGRFIYFTRVRKNGLRETASESVLQLAKRRQPAILSPSMNSIRWVTKVPFKIEKCEGKITKPELSKSSSLEIVTTKIEKPKLTASSDEEVKSEQESDMHLEMCLSPAENSSYSSKMFKLTGTSSQNSNSSASPPCQSKKETSMNMQCLQKNQCPDNVSSNQSESPRENACLKQISQQSTANNPQTKSEDVVSCYNLPELIDTSPKPSLLPIEQKSKAPIGFPRKCTGSENLHKSVKKLKWRKQSEKQRSLPMTEESNKKFVKKAGRTRERTANKLKYCMKNTEKRCKDNANRMLAICDHPERKITPPKKCCPFEKKKEILAARSNMVAVRNIACLAFPVEDVSHDRIIVTQHKKKKIKRVKQTVERAKAGLHSSTIHNKKVKDRKKAPNIQKYSYKQKIPFFIKESRNTKFNQSIIESSIAQTYSAFSRNAPISTTLHSSAKKSTHISPPIYRALVKKSLRKCHLRMKVSPPKPNIRVMTEGYILRTSKDKRNSKIIKTKVVPKRGLKCYSPGSCTKSVNKYAIVPFTRFSDKIESDCQTDPSVPFTDVKMAHCEINNDVSDFTNMDSNDQDDQKHGGTCWNRYKNTRESISSFYTKFSLSKNRPKKCPGSPASQRGQIGFPQETLTLPSGKTPGNRNKLVKSLRKCSRTNPACKSICSPPTTCNRARTMQAQNQCCEVTLIPSFFNFLKCMNKTISVPITFNQGSESSYEPTKKHPNDLKIKVPVNSMRSRKNFLSKYGSSGSEKSVKLVDNNFTETFSVLTLTDSECTSNVEDCKALERSKFADERKEKIEIKTQLIKNANDRQNVQNKLKSENNETRMNVAEETEQNTVEVGMAKKKNISVHSYETMSAAISILRKGRISSPNINAGQLGRREIIKSRSKIKNCSKLDMSSDYLWEQSSPSSNCSSYTVKYKTDHRVLTFGLIFVTIIVQVIIYFSVPQD